MRPSFSFSNFKPAQSAAASRQTAREAATFLQRHDKLAALLPTVTQITQLQKECARLLPDMFAGCTVLYCDTEQLLLAAPNAAIAARLRQRLPKLRQALLQAGWPIAHIRIRVQMPIATSRPAPLPLRVMPPHALDALASLQQVLEDSSRNTALKSALGRLLSRHLEREK